MTQHPVNDWNAELAKYATEATNALPPAAGEFIGTKGGILTYRGAAIPGNKMDVVILNFIRENQYYDKPYDGAAPGAPVCYAYGNDDKTRAPHAKASAPQATLCRDCPMNQFGSALVGKGKACKNVCKLAVVPVGALPELADAEVAFLKVSPTSVPNFSAYTQSIAETLKRPPFAVVTTIAARPHPKNQFEIIFTPVQPIEDPALLEAIMAKRSGIVLETVYPEITDAAPAARTPNARFGGRNKM